MKLRNALLALAIALTACTGAEDDQVATAAPESSTETTAEETSPTSAPDAVALTEDEQVSNAPEVVPSTTTTAPATTAPPNTTPTTIPPTTEVEPPVDDGDLGGDPSCSVPEYQLYLPPGWSHEGCARFSETAFPGPNADIEFRPEIDLHFTNAESFRDALMRIDENETILSSGVVTVNGKRAVRMEIDEGYSEMFGESGRRMTYVVDAGTGVFFAAGVELVDAASVQLYGSRAEQYANTVATLDLMMEDLAISSIAPAPVTCPTVVTISDPTLMNSGEADIDGDGDLEVFQLIYDGNDTPFVTIEGLVPGIVMGEVNSSYPDPMGLLGWADWDGDGMPEIITREGAGPATGDIYHVSTVVGCDIVPATGLLTTGSTQYGNYFRCNIGADGTMTSLTTRALKVDVNVDPVTFTTTTRESTYIAGALITSEPVVTVTTDQTNYLPDPQLWGLSTCGEFFDNQS